MSAQVQMNYIEAEVTPEQLLREYGAALARERREQRAHGRGALPPRLRALVIAAHSMRPRNAA